MKRTATNNYVPRALLVLLAAATLAAGLLALVGAETAWGAASRDFAPAQILSRGEAFPTVTADFNSDGKADLAGQKRGADSVSVLLGNGDGTFQAEQEFAVGSTPSFATSADFNADNKADLATANYSSSNVSVLLGNGDGTFQDAQNFAMATKPSRATSADFNGDNKADLAVNNQDSDNVSVLLGNGDGTFQGGENLTVGDTPTHVTSADLNADNKVDLATANYRSNNVSVLLGNGDGTFQGDRPLETGLTPRQVVAADFNGDEKADLATANWGTTFTGGGGISLSLGKGDGTFPDAKNFPGSPEGYPYHPYSLTAADFDEDGNTDLAATDTHPFPDNPTGVSVIKGTGDGAFHPPQSFMVGENPNFIIDVDLDADSYKDLVVAGTDQDLSQPQVVNTDYVAVLMNIKGPLDTSIDSGPTDDTVTKSGSATFSFSSSEDGSSFECSLDGSAWTECTSPKTVPDEGELADGWHYFEVRAIGAGDRRDDSPASQSWTVDSQAPSPPTITSPQNNTYDSDGSFSVSGSAEAASTVELFEGATSKDTAEADSSSGAWSIALSGVSEGAHTYSAKAKDAAGNTSSASDSVTVTVDKTAPKVSILNAASVTSSGVPLRKTDFKATFSEKMDTTTLNTSTFKLFKCSSAKDTACTTQITDALVTPSADGLSATLNPFGSKSTLLQAKTKYMVVVTTSAKDVARNALDQDSSTTGNKQKVEYFTTGSS